MIVNDAHLHLLVNHLPVVGSLIAVPLLLIALWLPRDRGALLGAVLVLVLAGGGAFVAEQTGHDAEEVVEDLPDVSEPYIEEHEERAEIATWVAGLAALAGLAVLALVRGREETPRVWVAALLVAALVSMGTLGWTSAAGGVIRHSEIRDGSPPPLTDGHSHDHDDDDD